MLQPVRPEAVREAIAWYVGNAPGHEAELVALARRFDLLPLLVDWTAFVGLSSSGQLFWVQYEPPHGIEDAEVWERDNWETGIRHFAFAVGSGRYPHLSWLEPIRGADCVTCPSCGGTGRPLIHGRPAPERVVCRCGGLGWLPPESA